MANDCCNSTLAKDQQFWKTLFEEQELARRISTLAEETNEHAWASYNLSHYGEVQVKVQATSCLGDNFMSDAYVIEARVLSEANNLYSFIKVLPSNTLMRESAKEWSLHEREVSVYCELFKVLRDLSHNREVYLDVPCVYYSNIDDLTDGSATCIVMENLKNIGYRMADKVHGADNAHTRIALTSLARYHSLTIAAVRQWWNDADKEFKIFPANLGFLLQKTLLELNPAGFIKGWIEVYRDFCRDIHRNDLAMWFESIESRLEDIMVADSLENSGPLACILHGDFWNNNMLYKYDGEDKPVALKMVDFQIARFGHPLQDFLYFVFSSTNPEERRLYFQDWLRHYFETLTISLKNLDIELEENSFDIFILDLKKKSISGMLWGSLVISLALNDSVVDGLNNIHDENSQQEQFPERELTCRYQGEVAPGMDFSEKITKILHKNKLSDSPIVANRLITLWEEVKEQTYF